MPEFYPEHTPLGASAMACGFLNCAEWLLSDEFNRNKIRGWSRHAIKKAEADCAKFAGENAAQIDAFLAALGRPGDMGFIGYNFFLTRNGEGAGFWDRGAGDPGVKLAQACRAYGPLDVEVSRGWLVWM